MRTIYWGGFQKREDLEENFRVTLTSPVEVLFAAYYNEDYSAEAFVLFRQDGKLMEVNGSHCSCYGLEDQWEPEEADAREILHRMTKGTMYALHTAEEKEELRAILQELA